MSRKVYVFVVAVIVAAFALGVLVGYQITK